jgi:predicted transcriptional regulator
MAARYKEGATVYELAAEYGCHRTTVSARLKKAGVFFRLQSPSSDDIASMVILYESGLSPEEVGEKLGFCANTVRTTIKGRDIKKIAMEGLG